MRLLRINFAVISLMALIGTACLPGQSTPTLPSRLGSELGQTGQPGQLTPVLPATDLAVGSNERFLVALLGPDNKTVNDASVDVSFFKVTGANSARLEGQTSAEYEESLPGKGAYVARADFSEPGDWGVVLQVQQPGQDPQQLRVGFNVKQKSSTPGIGDPVPASPTLIGTNPSEIEQFSSARPADPALYRLSIEQAVAAHKPFAVLFASPGFCTSQLCGPSYDLLQKLQAQHGSQANFIHVEIYKGGRPNEKQEVVPAVQEWGLTSEPWLFLVGADGRLADKFEGVFAYDELQQAVGQLVQGS